MSQTETRKPISVGAWIAIVVGGLLVAALMFGCLGALFFGVSSSSTLTPVPATSTSTSGSPTPSSPAPTAPAEK